MKLSSHTTLAAAARALALLLAFAPLLAGCGRNKQGDTARATPQPSATQAEAAASPSPAPSVDVAKLDADISRLERQAERNPGDEATRDELARAYVRRGDARFAARQLREALSDYQQALRLDPDNIAAQTSAATAKELLDGEKDEEDEHGAPAPLPITPNVADEEGKPAATPTPKKQ